MRETLLIALYLLSPFLAQCVVSTILNYIYIVTLKIYDYFSFGSATGGSNKWALCVLPLNMINQKFYSFFYFWLFFLMIISLTILVIRIGLIGSPSLRELSTKFHLDGLKFKVCPSFKLYVPISFCSVFDLPLCRRQICHFADGK